MGKPARQSWKLKDLRESPEVTIHEWSLEAPSVEYTATAAHYGHQAGAGLIHFAQVVGGVPMNALAITVPTSSIKETLLPNLRDIRKRFAKLEEEGRIESVQSLDPRRLVDLRQGGNYVQKAADRIRVAINDDFGSLDFFKLPVLPAAFIEAHPNREVRIDDVVRVTLSTSLFRDLVGQMEEIESYEPQEEQDNADDDN